MKKNKKQNPKKRKIHEQLRNKQKRRRLVGGGSSTQLHGMDKPSTFIRHASNIKSTFESIELQYYRKTSFGN